jgi:hypothetical protein
LDVIGSDAEKPLAFVSSDHQQRPLIRFHVTDRLVEPGVQRDTGVAFDLDVETVEDILHVRHTTVLSHDLRRAPSVLGVEQVTGYLDGFALTALAFLTGL